MKKNNRIITFAIILLLITSSCKGKNEVVKAKADGKKADVTIEQFDFLKNEPIKRANLINELDKESRWNFLKKLLPCLKISHPPVSEITFLKENKLVIMNGSGYGGGITHSKIIFGTWGINNNEMIIEIIGSNYKKNSKDEFPAFQKIVFDDFYFTAEKRDEGGIPLYFYRIVFKIKDVAPSLLLQRYKDKISGFYIYWFNYNGHESLKQEEYLRNKWESLIKEGS